jgi:hypothetical protein
VSNKDTGRNVEHAVFSIEVPNGGAAAGRVTFAKDFLKVAVQKLNNSIIHSSTANLSSVSPHPILIRDRSHSGPGATAWRAPAQPHNPQNKSH